MAKISMKMTDAEMQKSKAKKSDDYQDFTVDINGFDVRFEHRSEMSQSGNVEIYEQKFDNISEIGIYFSKDENGKIYADFFCGDSDSAFNLNYDVDSTSHEYDSVSEMIKGFKEWIHGMIKKSATKKLKAKKSKVQKSNDALFDTMEQARANFDNACMDYARVVGCEDEVRRLLNEIGRLYDQIYDACVSSDDSEFVKAVKTLKAKGYRVVKGDDIDEDLIVDTEEEDGSETEETATEEESEEVEEVEDESDDDVEVDVDVETEKSKKSKSLKSAYDVFKKKGWIGKTDDKGIDSEKLESEVLDDPVAKVPETPEPTENVEQTETGVPEDAPEPESENNDDVTEKDGNDMDALEPESENNQDISTTDADDIEALINQKRAEKSKDQTSASGMPSINGTVPVSMMYRQTKMGQDKMPISAVIPNNKQVIGKKRI